MGGSGKNRPSNRLYQSIGSPVEELFFRTYYEKYNPKHYNNFPALIPQVYLHYDPFTLKQLNGGSRIPRQRMDFLLLLPGNQKIVIESMVSNIIQKVIILMKHPQKSMPIWFRKIEI